MTTDTTTHDFKAALENFKNYAPHYDLYDSTEESICHALRIADALMREPNEGMIDAAKSIGGINCLKEQGPMLYNLAVYKAMRDQMLKEL